MLSRIISGRDADRAESAVFRPAVPDRALSVRQQPPGQTAPDQEIQTLRDQIRNLQSEVEVARRDSFEAGHRQGEQQARGELVPVIERMNASVAELVGLRSEIRRRAEKDVVQLALLISRRVLHRELSVDPNALTALARIVFERLARAESYRITVHPGFAAAVQSALPVGQTGQVRIEPDPGCAPGTLIVRSEEGVMDASVDSQLEEITRGLTDRLAHSGASK